LFLKGALATPVVVAGASLVAPRPADARNDDHDRGVDKGPSTTVEPYLAPSIAGAKTVSILTVGEAVNGYRMVGLCDGLGAFRSSHGDFTVLMNHEIGAALGRPRAHGSRGAFVSRWEIDAHSLRVEKGQDMTPSPAKVFLWNGTGYTPGTTAWDRLCSADLADQDAFRAHGLGTDERLFLNGEETSEGRAWARVATGPNAGEAWQLPRLGRMAYENAIACPRRQMKTIVACMDDSSVTTATTGTPSEVYFYVGMKQGSGHPVVRAGLTNGALYGVAVTVDGVPVGGESDQFGLGNTVTGYIAKGRFTLVNLGDVSNLSGAQLQAQSIASGVMRFQRCEDGAWDPCERKEDNYYFVTTATATTTSRLWHLNFDDIERPENGGTIEILLRGDEGHRMLDNVGIDRLGRVVMDEDPGGNNRIAKIRLYGIDSRELIQVAAHNPRFFDPDTRSTTFQTNDEESSGIIDVAHILGEGWFLVDVQSHRPAGDPELVEGGQLLALWVHPDVGVIGGDRGGNRHDDNHGRR
jgi:hypothetical protein